MQFLIIAHDGKDDGAAARRAAARPAHLETAKSLIDTGNMVIGGAILDGNDNMIGSSMIVEFADRAALDAWMEQDPYIKGDVWQDVTVLPFRTTIKP